MFFIPSLIFAFSVNIDAFLVGASYGIRKIHITLLQNLFISLISFAGTALSLFLGGQLLTLLPGFLTNCLGSGILLLLGAFYMLKSLIPSEQDLHAESLQPSLSMKETFFMGAALSANNMGIGIGASISGIALLPTAVVTFLASVLFLFGGNHLGNSPLLRFSRHYADMFSGGMLILLGIYNYFF